ncbi:amidase [Kitasatospora cinereorecta]|uniref:amidase n=1 Tax=Kitasatospora cinereorecta TaxID=285560 RepID=UPI0031F8EB43
MEPLIQPVSLVEEAAALRAGRPGPEEHVDRVFTRIDRTDPVVRAFVPEPGRHARLTAEALTLADRTAHDAQGPPLYGVAVGIKDIIHVDGLPTHAGSALPPGVLGGPEGGAVRRLRAAGALIAGKTVTAEFAVRAPGPTRNPHDLGHTPGGSSGGSAAAVAAGMVPLALGTQTLGSVIRPAAYCGVVGFRPTYGRIPTDGVIANAPTLDAVGLFTSDLAGARLAAAVLCDGWTPVPQPAREPVLGVPTGAYLDRAQPAARDAYTRHLDGLGLPVRHVDAMPDFEDVMRHLFTINRYELAQVHAELFARFAALYRPETAAAIRRGQEVDRADYLAALAARSGFQRRLADLATDHGIDLWAVPAATGPAPRGLDSTGDAVMSAPWSYAGLPAITLPVGTSAGLPLGLQLVAPANADERLLALAALVQTRAHQ